MFTKEYATIAVKIKENLKGISFTPRQVRRLESAVNFEESFEGMQIFNDNEHSVNTFFPTEWNNLLGNFKK